jgi:hypothetical protein
MWEMAAGSIGLFVRGKLFAQPAKVFRQIAIGVLATAAVLAVLAVIGVPPWLATLLAGFGGSTLQPNLFRICATAEDRYERRRYRPGATDRPLRSSPR